MRTMSWLSIVVGGAAGAVAALAAAPDLPESVPAEPVPALPPVAAKPEPAAITAVAVTSAAAVRSAAPRVTATVSAAPAVSVASSSPAATSEAPRASTAAQVTRFEVDCQEKKDPVACRGAARAYEEGGAVTADPTKVRLFRKIELTFLVKQCESQVAQACARLAERYDAGDGVAKNPKNAEVLRQRAKELCAIKAGPGCEQLGR